MKIIYNFIFNNADGLATLCQSVSAVKYVQDFFFIITLGKSYFIIFAAKDCAAQNVTVYVAILKPVPP